MKNIEQKCLDNNSQISHLSELKTQLSLTLIGIPPSDLFLRTMSQNLRSFKINKTQNFIYTTSDTS